MPNIFPYKPKLFCVFLIGGGRNKKETEREKDKKHISMYVRCVTKINKYKH